MKSDKKDTNKIGVAIIIATVVLVIVVAIIFVVKALVGEPAAKENGVQIDYTEEKFEDALNTGEDTTGKIVTFKVAEVKPDSFCGYNLWSGEHLNFCSVEDPGVEAGQELTVKIINVSETFGSYIIKYEIIK